ncbi:uncharacterized protein K452DRAFT_293465 [Aplosporella prunicola CBS 121167]|uniref:GST N-terminal domain-containing protein n=1 Tax=Aplosporella prunicola CBS 121167 TaxID=1176127 RepID=A0A6A6AVX3_9PEZI|nr:uncharacterized protein K452DRAFT_293465 [Aplosporella prunicola CBS 121167]KAF2135104.1 hypothetical protein K452DRAFT_293465 [Aplosporella prunicola CBS 121167]
MPTSDPSSPIRFYDIGMRPPVEKNACSPNPWKARLALNFKGVPLSTTWVPLPDVSKVRNSLKVPAVRKFGDGSDFFTLPIIEDPNTEELVGDSFDIAAYLQKTYPDSGAGDLFPPLTLDYKFENTIHIPLTESRENLFPEYTEYARFNVHVDAAFSTHVQLAVKFLPFDPACEDICKAEFVRRTGGFVKSWEEFAIEGEAREKLLASFRDTLGGLAELFKKDTSGPFILGTRACYADIIVGGWLRNMRATLPENEWEELRSWHEGIFGRLHDALEVYADMK